MDTEQQIRLNFLDEADEYLEYLESHLLGLANTLIEPQTIDTLLRSAHSIKGGAAMMGFKILSQTAHRLEDFLKILRVRYIAQEITTEIETLLLQSVDCLRIIVSLNRQGVEVANSEVGNRAKLVFDQLTEHLGELNPTDEDALMRENEGVDPALLIFEEGVDTILDQLEARLPQFKGTELSEELAAIAQELIAFGNMVNLEPFVQLSQYVYQQATTLSEPEIESLATQALKTWKRSHALIVRGSWDKLPSSLEENNSPHNFSNINQPPVSESSEENSLPLHELESSFDWDTSQSPNQTESELEFLEEDSVQLNELQSAFDLDTAESNSSTISQDPRDFVPQETPYVSKMTKVPVEQLKEFNNLFEQLILDRNVINLRLKQLQNIVALMSQRINQMENSNTQLRQWYDRASVEGLFLESGANRLPAISQEQPPINSVNNSDTDVILNKKSLQEDFDPLEMDRYSDIHLICQEQIETIVQLQEVAADLELEIQETNQAVRNLNYTTQFMQGNVIRTQMLPFAEIIKRFPRLIRDLNLKFNQEVKLTILGENTLLDRSFVKPLGDSLIHLLRNSFAHGIEDRETRIAEGKPSSGTITIQATNKGTYTLITFSDDGRGISTDQICDRLGEMGIPASQMRQVSEQELLNFIFEPGFSTAKQVTELSGRGMGMDIVRTNLQEIEGEIKVLTEPGQGTKFILKIPFTLSILKVAIIEQAGIILAIPADSVQELLPSWESQITSLPNDGISLGKPSLTEEISTGSDHFSERIESSEDTTYINWHGTEIPLLEIEKILVYNHPTNSTTLTGNPAINKTMALVVGDKKLCAALKITRFWQEQESTIRPIDSPIPLPLGVIGSMIFGDGKVIPLIDPTILIEECLQNTATNNQSNQNLTTSPNLTTVKTILVVDDSINVRRYLSLTLEKAGYQVEQAKDGQEALDKLLSGLVVQAIICDIEMPRIDGYTVLEEIQAQPELKHIPVAMLTSRSNEKHRKLAMNLGASAYFSKPYNEQELLDKLAELLS